MFVLVTAVLRSAVAVSGCRPMPCYHPIIGWRAKHKNASGRRPLVFNPNEGFKDMEVKIPCGRCIGCRLENSRQWAVRMMHEAQMHEENCFLTLTYNDDHVPSDFSLCLDDYQKFMKRLRKSIAPKKVRFFHCGEYGETTGRPHYHAILFGHNFADREFYKATHGGNLFISQTLDDLWQHGNCNIGDVTFESAAYVARYVTKKITGDMAETHYQGRQPEYATMSRRPGIGMPWFEKFGKEVYRRDDVVVRGKLCKPPRFYDKALEDTDFDRYQKVMGSRRRSGREDRNNPEREYDRLVVKEAVKIKSMKFFSRSVDGEH